MSAEIGKKVVRDWTETIKILGVPNRAQTGKGFVLRRL
jgi:hypothetical protein